MAGCSAGSTLDGDAATAPRNTAKWEPGKRRGCWPLRLAPKRPYTSCKINSGYLQVNLQPTDYMLHILKLLTKVLHDIPAKRQTSTGSSNLHAISSRAATTTACAPFSLRAARTSSIFASHVFPGILNTQIVSIKNKKTEIKQILPPETLAKQSYIIFANFLRKKTVFEHRV